MQGREHGANEKTYRDRCDTYKLKCPALSSTIAMNMLQTSCEVLRSIPESRSEALLFIRNSCHDHNVLRTF
jgi:hypothetical protein